MKLINPESQIGMVLQYIKEAPGASTEDAKKFFTGIISPMTVSSYISTLFYEACLRREKVDGELRYWFVTDKRSNKPRTHYFGQTKTQKAQTKVKRQPRDLTKIAFIPPQPEEVSEPEVEVIQQDVICSVPNEIMLLIPVGNQTATLTIEQAKALSSTLSSVFR